MNPLKIVTCILLHALQISLLYSLKIWNHLYKNRMGFMRSVLFYSKKIRQGYLGTIIQLLPVLCLIVGILMLYLRFKRQPLKWLDYAEYALLFITIASFICWQWKLVPVETSIFYLISGVILLIFLCQLVIVITELPKMKFRS